MNCCTFWRLKFTTVTKFRASKMAKNSVFRASKSSKIDLTQKSEWQKNHKMSTLCIHKIFTCILVDWIFPKASKPKWLHHKLRQRWCKTILREIDNRIHNIAMELLNQLWAGLFQHNPVDWKMREKISPREKLKIQPHRAFSKILAQHYAPEPFKMWS